MEAKKFKCLQDKNRFYIGNSQKKLDVDKIVIEVRNSRETTIRTLGCTYPKPM
jgi:hypothetical protein